MLLAVRILSYGCTWEVWRALFRALQTSRVHPLLDIRTPTHEPILNYTSEQSPHITMCYQLHSSPLALYNPSYTAGRKRP